MPVNPMRTEVSPTNIKKVECVPAVEAREWDELAAHFDGGFFHCHAYAMHEAGNPNVGPLFVKAINQRGECVGIAVGTMVSPRHWPFARFCRTAVFGALPATREKSAEIERAIVAAIEQELKGRGVFQIHIRSYDSPHSANLLSSLSYQLHDRFEFYIDMSNSLEAIWEGFKSERRTNIRKAAKVGVTTNVENTIAGLQLLHRFQNESMQRRGIGFRLADGQAERTKAILLDAERARVLVSYVNGTAVNAAMFGVFRGKAYYLHSGSSLNGNTCRGPAHLIWSMIEMFKAEAGTTLNLGGDVGSPGEQDSQGGLYSFKQYFGATLISQPAGTKVISLSGAKLNAVLPFLKRMILNGGH